MGANQHRLGRIGVKSLIIRSAMWLSGRYETTTSPGRVRRMAGASSAENSRFPCEIITAFWGPVVPLV